MLKSFWKFTLLTSVVVVAGHAIAQNATVPTQQPIWSKEVEGGAAFIAVETQLLMAQSGPTGEPSTLSALDPATGKQLWKSDRLVGSLIAVENQTIYADDFGLSGWQTGNLLRLDAKTGKTQAALPLVARQPDRSAKNAQGATIGFDGVIGTSQGAFIYQSSITRDSMPFRTRVTAQTPTQVLWTFDTSPNSLIFSRSGKVQNGVVVLPIVLTNSKTDPRSTQVKALDAATGKLLWELQTEEGSANSLGDAVYVVGSTRKGGANVSWLKAYDLKTGKERWTRSGLNGRPELVNDREVFVPDRSEESSARYTVLDQQTGAVLRQITLAPSSRYGGSPRLAGNTIYQEVVQSTGSWTTVENYSRIEAFDATTGKPLWQTPLLRGMIPEAILMGDRLVIYSSGFGGEKNVVQGFKIP